MRLATSAPLVFLVGLAAAFAGDIVARLDPDLHHAGWAHALHTVLLAVPAGVLAALALREGESVAIAALLAAAGWGAGFLVLLAL